MATYAELKAQADLKAQRARQDEILARQHAAFDLQAQDIHHKYERFRFSVVGEGSMSALDNYRRNFDQIRWRDGV